jgi:hypothetical protein
MLTKLERDGSHTGSLFHSVVNFVNPVLSLKNGVEFFIVKDYCAVLWHT